MMTFSSLASVYAQLANFANLSNFWSLFDTAFGSSYDFATAASLRSQWQAQDFSLLPTVEVISSDVLAGARGSYDGTTNRIYLADSLVANGTPEAIATVLLKQIGNFVAAKVNNQSPLEDQGGIFAQQVQTLQNQNLNVSITIPRQNAIIQSQDPSSFPVSFSISQEGTSVASGDYRIDALLNGYKWGVTNISFSFYSGGSYYGSEKGLGIVSEGIKNNVRNILNNVIAPLININFVEVADSSSSYGQIRYLLSTDAGYAYAYFPTSTDANQGNENDRAGDVVLDPSYDNSSSVNGFQSGPGTNGYQSLIHETLHALGLKHPNNYNNNGVDVPPYLPYGEDNWDNTLMTYNFYSGAQPSTPMGYDVLALQYLYGAKSFNASNTTYNFTNTGLYSDGLRTVGSSTLSNKLTIWDSGGIDTLDFSNLGFNASGYRFDLRAGGWLSTQTAFNGKGYNVISGPPVSFTDGTTYRATTSGTRLAYGVTVENLINSSSNDLIIANSAANVFSGYGLSNTTGADIIEGANSLDFLDLSVFNVANVTQTQSGNNLVLGIGSGRSITIKDYYAVSESDRIQLGFSNNNNHTVIEIVGNTKLLKDGANKYFAQVGNNTPIAIKNGTTHISEGIYTGWQTLAAETVNGVNQVLWITPGGNLMQVWQMNSSWVRVSSQNIGTLSSSAALAQETVFGVDANGDGTIGSPSTVAIESVGNTSLVKDSSNKLFAQVGSNTPIAIKNGTTHISEGIYAGWQTLAAETVNGVNQVLWITPGGNLMQVWQMNSNWVRVSAQNIGTLSSAAALAQETVFGVDANGDGVIGTRIAIESVGNTSLIKDSNNKFFAQVGNNTPIAIKNGTTHISEGIYAGWQTLAAETVNGVNQVLWITPGGNLMQVWQMNSNWVRVSGQNIGTLSSSAALAQETVFGVDANGNGTIGNPNSLSLMGTSGNDTLIGGANNDVLTGLGGKDRLTGGLGSDRFVYQTLTHSLLANFDEITDFNATTDRFLVSTTRSGFNNVGTVTSLDNAGISTKLIAASFGANSAASFTFGSRTFVAINDATAGFSQTTDAIIEITGLTGTLGLGNFVTV